MKKLPLAGHVIFCEDVRDEVVGTVSLIGVLPDNIAVPVFPTMLGKLAMYSKITFDPVMPPSNVTVRLVVDGTTLVSSPFDQKLIEDTATDVIARGTPIATVIARIQASPFPVNGPTMVESVLEANGEEILLGSLRINLAS